MACVSTTERDVSARVVILAMGLRPATLDVPGEARLRGRGVSHCASCDGPLLRDRVVAVVGGGDSGLQEGLTLARHASAVHLIERGESLTAQETYRQRVMEDPRITVRCGTVVEEILGEEAVSGLKLRELRAVPSSIWTSLPSFHSLGFCRTASL